MSTLKQAQQINEEVTEWPLDYPEIRSQNVLSWCATNGIKTTLDGKQLMAAMQRFPYWDQGPANYLDFVLAYEAAKE